MIKFYAYTGCSTCRNARKWLDAQGVKYEEVAIREQPPSKTELDLVLKAQGGEIRRLFNTSGQDYRALGIKDLLPTLSAEAALLLLSQNGHLVKRPVLIDLDREVGLVGFREADWADALA